MNKTTKFDEQTIQDVINKAKLAEKMRPKTGDKYSLKILEGENEVIYLQGEDIESKEGLEWIPNGYKLYGNIGTLAGFYYGSGTCNDVIGTVLEIEYDYVQATILIDGKEQSVTQHEIVNTFKKDKILRLYKNDMIIEEVVLDQETSYIDGTADKEIRFEDKIIKCISLRELYRFPSWINPEKPFHRIIPFEISSIAFDLNKIKN